MIVFDEVIADMLRHTRLNPIVTELVIRARKLNISFVFITKSYSALPKILDQILHTILLSKFEMSESFSKSHLIIHKIIFTKNVLQNHILF